MWAVFSGLVPVPAMSVPFSYPSGHSNEDKGLKIMHNIRKLNTTFFFFDLADVNLAAASFVEFAWTAEY